LGPEGGQPGPYIGDIDGMRQVGDAIDRNLDRQHHFSALRFASVQHWQTIIRRPPMTDKLPQSLMQVLFDRSFRRSDRLQRHRVPCNVLIQGVVGPDVVKLFGVVEAVFFAGGAIFGFNCHFRELVDGGTVGAG